MEDRKPNGLRASSRESHKFSLNQINGVYSKKTISNSSPKQLIDLFPPKLTSFVARNKGTLRSPNSTLSNRTNNIVDPNADVVQSKVFFL
jgi:hypothetical protein